MPWGIYIPADESKVLEFRLFGQLNEYQEAVGGWVECIDLETPPATFFVNEEGKIQNLPQNRRATLALWLHNRGMHGRDVLCGNAVLIGQPDDEEGETQDIPDELVAILMRTDSYKLEVETMDAPGVWNGNQARYGNWVDAYNAALGLYERWTLATNVRVLAA